MRNGFDFDFRVQVRAYVPKVAGSIGEKEPTQQELEAKIKQAHDELMAWVERHRDVVNEYCVENPYAPGYGYR